MKGAHLALSRRQTNHHVSDEPMHLLCVTDSEHPRHKAHTCEMGTPVVRACPDLSAQLLSTSQSVFLMQFIGVTFVSKIT